MSNSINFINTISFPNEKFFNNDQQQRIVRAVSELSTNNGSGVAQDRLFSFLGKPNCFGNNVAELVEQGKLIVREFGICASDVRLYIPENA